MTCGERKPTGYGRDPSSKAIPKVLIQDVRSLIESARQDVARSVNSALVTLYWNIGQRIRQDILKEKRAEYGQQIVAALGRQLGWTHFKALSESGIRVAAYLTELPPRAALEKRLHEAVWRARLLPAPATGSQAGCDGRSRDRGSGTFAKDRRERRICQHN
jgi:hypothetical protein